jgi:hypothetical protein
MFRCYRTASLTHSPGLASSSAPADSRRRLVFLVMAYATGTRITQMRSHKRSEIGRAASVAGEHLATCTAIGWTAPEVACLTPHQALGYRHV